MEQGLGAGRLAQLVEHRLYTPAVTGSSPVPPTRILVVSVLLRGSKFVDGYHVFRVIS